MSAILCGKRSFFEESTAAVPKRIRCSSSSPIRFSPSPPRQTSSCFDQSYLSPSQSAFLVEQLVVIFPDMEKELLERALQECGDDLDSAIRSLHELRLGSSHNDLAASVDTSDAGPEANVQLQLQGLLKSDQQTEENVPGSGAEWVELFVGEMMSASNVDDAKARASKALEVLERSIVARATAESSQNILEDNARLKQQMEALIQENTWLKRAVSIQHERQKEHEDRGKELEHLKQMVTQYQEQLRTLEVNNYALTMHLKQAQQSSSIPGRFNPDVF